MPCYGCGTGFGAFKKEHGCKNCGMAFCMKCLPNKLPIAKKNNEKHRVCNKCYKLLTGATDPDKDKARYSPPENYKKRVAALEEREAKGRHPSGHGHTVGHTRPLKHPPNMSAKDAEIQQRLEKLREKTAEEKAAGRVSERDIDDRLARLKGMDPSRYNNTNKQQHKFYHPPDRRTQQEQMNDLLDEICDEVELDSKLPDPAKEIENRLAQLRNKDKPKIDSEGSRLLTPIEKKASENIVGKGENAASDENNLNKPSLRDSQTFSQNITNTSDGQRHSKGDDQRHSVTLSNDNKPSNAEGDDPISPEEIHKILSEAAQELEQDANKALKGLEEDKEIMRKLQEIKQKRKESKTDINKDEAMETSDSENEDKMADHVIKQALEEVKLDEAAAKDGVDVDQIEKKSGKKRNTSKEKLKKEQEEEEEWDDPDELPYCCICTEDAAVRCMGCDRDLYCNKCFKDGHKELGLDDHVSVKYTPPKGRT